jgi:hypothetical protein
LPERAKPVLPERDQDQIDRKPAAKVRVRPRPGERARELLHRLAPFPSED